MWSTSWANTNPVVAKPDIESKHASKNEAQCPLSHKGIAPKNIATTHENATAIMPCIQPIAVSFSGKTHTRLSNMPTHKENTKLMLKSRKASGS